MSEEFEDYSVYIEKVEKEQEKWEKPKKKEPKKFDNGKLRYDLVPAECLEALTEIYTFGAGVYGDNNWQNLPDSNNRYYAALLRHLMLYRQGELRDKDSGKLHTAHVAWNAFALLWHDLHKTEYKEETSNVYRHVWHFSEAKDK